MNHRSLLGPGARSACAALVVLGAAAFLAGLKFAPQRALAALLLGNSYFLMLAITALVFEVRVRLRRLLGLSLVLPVPADLVREHPGGDRLLRRAPSRGWPAVQALSLLANFLAPSALLLAIAAKKDDRILLATCASVCLGRGLDLIELALEFGQVRRRQPAAEVDADVGGGLALDRHDPLDERQQRQKALLERAGRVDEHDDPGRHEAAAHRLDHGFGVRGAHRRGRLGVKARRRRLTRRRLTLISSKSRAILIL